MRHASMYRIGGSSLALGAVLSAVGLILHAPQPMDVGAFGMIPQGPWIASHWLFVLGTLFTTSGLLALARHLFDTAGEGWAVLGLGTTVVTSALFVAIVAPEIVAFPVLVQMSSDPGSQYAYHAVNLNLMSLVHVGIPLFSAGLAFYGLGMLGDPAIPRWMGLAGVAVGVIGIAANWVLAEQWMAFRAVSVAEYAWLALAGKGLMGMKGGSGK